MKKTGEGKRILFEKSGCIGIEGIIVQSVPEPTFLSDGERPNNVDVEYGFRLNDFTTTDILAFTERERQQIRIFSVPDMKPLDGSGLCTPS